MSKSEQSSQNPAFNRLNNILNTLKAPQSTSQAASSSETENKSPAPSSASREAVPEKIIEIDPSTVSKILRVLKKLTVEGYVDNNRANLEEAITTAVNIDAERYPDGGYEWSWIMFVVWSYQKLMLVT